MTTMTLRAIPSFGISAVFGEMDTVNMDLFEDLPDVPLSNPKPDRTTLKSKETKKRAAKKKASATKHKAPKRRQRASRPRRVVPDIKTYIDEAEPKDSDVVSGRGGRSNHHPGNKACWLVMLSRREQYRACETDEEKNEVAQEVVDFVHRQNGRYVQREADTGRWFVLPDKIALDKAKQGLRDRYVPHWVNGTKKPSQKAPKKNQAKQTPNKKSKPAPRYQEKDLEVDGIGSTLALPAALPSFENNDEKSLKLVDSHSLLDLFPMESLSNSLLGELVCSNNAAFHAGGGADSKIWDDMFAKGISGYEAV